MRLTPADLRIAFDATVRSLWHQMKLIEGQVATSPRAAGVAIPREPAAIFYPRLEALRGVAALTVAAFHTWQSPWLNSVGQSRNFLSAADEGTLVENLGAVVLRVVGNGYGVVVLFFVISGFVLSGSLVRGPQDLATGASRFLIARLFRIYPAVFATIAIFAALYWTMAMSINGAAGYSVPGLLRNALLLDTSIDGVMWSLQLELLAIPLIFVTYHAWLRWGAAALIAPFCLLAALSFWGPWTCIIGGLGLGAIYAFVLGMAAFLVAPRLIERCSPRTATVVLMGASALFFASRPVLGYASNWAVLAEAIFGGILVAVLAFGHPSGTRGPVGSQAHPVLRADLLQFLPSAPADVDGHLESSKPANGRDNGRRTGSRGCGVPVCRFCRRRYAAGLCHVPMG